ncbi:MAG: 2-amino-4-hydroxy-6-hydroxymethyldihydropteridine diphosphokinase [Proteobacteria bacterium]|nr:2-amino-4-hydroxy-6-hydroxymethyldihydropteridine diphosphokinase [Pseudomonadota bacterium]MBU1641170.1 2-amino-4-hydroxy-6-hydroxymethyldihydropteridine diphosphokinase [Pseudomonadota bacterium]
MALVFIGLGSNLGHGLQNLQQAWQRLGQTKGVTLLGLSSPYKTEPVGISTDHWFTNAVGVLETTLVAHELLAVMLDIEKAMGRDRSAGHDRSVDLDILYYDDQLIQDADLEVPHPGISSRLFVLAPLVEIAPDHLHPGTGLTSRQMMMTLQSTDRVEKTRWK